MSSDTNFNGSVLWREPDHTPDNVTSTMSSDFSGFDKHDTNIVLVTYSLIAVLGVICNVLSVIVFTRGRLSSQRDIRILFINLCITDLLYSISGPVPIAVYHYAGVSFPNNDILCKMWKFVFINSVDMSPMANIAIAIDRLIVVFFPTHMLRANRKYTLWAIVVAFWVITLGVNVEYIYRPIVRGSDGALYCSSYTVLMIDHFDAFTYYMMMKFFVPTIAIVVIYSVIIAKLSCCQSVVTNSSNADPQMNRMIRARNQLLKMMFVIALVTFIAWTPSNIEMILQLRTDHLPGRPLLAEKLSAALFGLQLTNGFTTPIIFFSFDKHFRSDLREILGCCRKNKNSEEQYDCDGTQTEVSPATGAVKLSYITTADGVSA